MRALPRDASVSELLQWVWELDDPYKIWMFGLINAAFAYAIVTTGNSIDPTALEEMVIGRFIQTFGGPTLGLLWVFLAEPVLQAAGLVQLAVSAYAIWRSGKHGIAIALASFLGWFGMFSNAILGLPIWFLYLSLLLVVVSYFVARNRSRYDIRPPSFEG